MMLTLLILSALAFLLSITLLGILTFILVKKRKELRDANDYLIMFEESPTFKWVIDPESKKFLAVNKAMIRHY